MPRKPLPKINPEQLSRRPPALDKLYAEQAPPRTDEERMLAYMNSLEHMHDTAANEGNWKAQIAAIKQAWDMLMDKKKALGPSDKPEDEPDVSHLSTDELREKSK